MAKTNPEAFKTVTLPTGGRGPHPKREEGIIIIIIGILSIILGALFLTETRSNTGEQGE